MKYYIFTRSRENDYPATSSFPYETSWDDLWAAHRTWFFSHGVVALSKSPQGDGYWLWLRSKDPDRRDKVNRVITSIAIAKSETPEEDRLLTLAFCAAVMGDDYLQSLQLAVADDSREAESSQFELSHFDAFACVEFKTKLQSVNELTPAERNWDMEAKSPAEIPDYSATLAMPDSRENRVWTAQCISLNTSQKDLVACGTAGPPSVLTESKEARRKFLYLVPKSEIPDADDSRGLFTRGRRYAKTQFKDKVRRSKSVSAQRDQLQRGDDRHPPDIGPSRPTTPEQDEPHAPHGETEFQAIESCRHHENANEIDAHNNGADDIVIEHQPDLCDLETPGEDTMPSSNRSRPRGSFFIGLLLLIANLLLGANLYLSFEAQQENKKIQTHLMKIKSANDADKASSALEEKSIDNPNQLLLKEIKQQLETMNDHVQEARPDVKELVVQLTEANVHLNNVIDELERIAKLQQSIINKIKNITSTQSQETTAQQATDLGQPTELAPPAVDESVNEHAQPKTDPKPTADPANPGDGGRTNKQPNPFRDN